MSKNIILIAEDGEKKLLEQHLRGQWLDNQWLMADGSQWDILTVGVGALNILQSLRGISTDTHLLNIGYAGSANFEIGTLVEVTEARLNHPCVNYPEPVLMLQPIDTDLLQRPAEHLQAVCYSNTDFVTHSDYHDCVFDMEVAYIAGMGFKHLTALKVVSDNLSLHDYRETSKFDL